MSYEESGVTIYQAGDMVPAGYYARVDDGSYHLVLLAQPGLLPPSFDGHVALYRVSACALPRPTDAAAALAGTRVGDPAQVHAL